MTKHLRAHPYITLLFFSLFLYLAGNQLLPVTDTAESNYALTAKEMVLSGDWLSPQIYGHYWYDKPIFYYWELAISFALFGFNEMAARLPSAILGTLSLLFTYWFARRIYGEKVGWLAALILGTSVEFWLLSKAIITDATLFLFMSGAIAFFYLGYSEDRKYYFLCYLFAALATLTKGPIGILLPGLAALLFLAYNKDLSEMKRVHLFSGLSLFFLLCGLWYGPMYYLHGFDFILNFLGVHNFLRATVAEHASHNTWYFYLIVYLVGFAPWSFTVPYSLYRKWKEKSLDLRSASGATQLLTIYAAVVIIFFQLIATKYTTYTFPALFSLSILTALLYEDITIRIERAALSAALLYTTLAIFIAPGIMLSHSGKEIGVALAHMDTTGETIAFAGDYRTSAVFYSGKTIYLAVPGKEIESMRPGDLSWNAKNVMPLMAAEDLLRNQNSIIITKDEASSPLLTAMDDNENSFEVHVPGEYTIWLRKAYKLG